ncbi:hypothetical protein [Actinomadura fibrosa]|uniref:HEAT repeat domain-containing protein n=1 Tax=Actinomadura fibrosa TaxID=111802 RepID=A0ABW2XDJ4_9ACTN|nr:hypothetical protein [Actinomadura fibrosa]
MLDDLYAAFADVTRPSSLDGCPCCVAPGEDRPLLDRPLRDLTPDDLGRYAAKALNTWGGPDDLRYFAPRLLELAAADDLDAEPICLKLAQAGWRDWPQRDAVTAFLDAFWSRTLARFPSRPSAGTALCALGGAAADLAPRLSAWGRLDSTTAIRHLHAFTTDELTWRRGRPRLLNAFWDDTGVAYEQVVAWLTGGDAAEAVRDAFERTDDEEILDLLIRTEERLTP